MRKYTTVTGDTFDSISFNIYGKEKYSTEIMKANLDLIGTIIFESGTNINIPDIDTTEESTLPPWK